MAALQLSPLYYDDTLYGDEMVFDPCRTCSFSSRVEERRRRAPGETRAQNSLSPWRGAERVAQVWWERIPPETSLGIVPRGEGRKTKRGRGGETGEPGGKSTTAPDNSLAHQSTTRKQRGNRAAVAFRGLFTHFLYIFYANHSLYLPSLIKQLYY